jgi:hypothetical protein
MMPVTKDLFEIRLSIAHPGAPGVQQAARLAADAELALVMSTICRWLARQDVVVFEACGFGEQRWPVDVGVDLAVVAQQIPDILHGLLDRRAVDLDFYEQGLQRLVTFEPVDQDNVHVACRSGTSWTPTPDVYAVACRDVSAMFAIFGKMFAEVAQSNCPGPVSHEMFQSWLRRFNSGLALLNASSPS